MSKEAPRRTFPKKAGSLSFVKDAHMKKKKSVNGSVGEVAMKRKHSVKVKSSADGITLSEKNKKKIASRMKVVKNGKAKFGVNKRRKNAKHGEPVKGTSIDHKMLGGSDDEMYSFGDDVMDVTDMFEDGGEETTVPVINSGESLSLNEKRNLFKKAKFSQEEKEPEIVEFSTGRGSSRFQLSDDCDSEEDASLKREERETLMKGDANFDSNDDSESEYGDATVQSHANASYIKNRVAESEVLQDHSGMFDEEEEDDEEVAVASFRAEMADLPLGKVREMKDKLGLKLFNKAYFGITEKDKKTFEDQKKVRESMKEEHRGQHRPKEISSKKPVSAFRPVYNTNIGKKKRDPRFDSRAGQFKERCFDDNYRFLEDLRKQEREQLCKEATECDERGDAETAEKIREVIRRMDNREKTKAERRMKEETLRELRQENIERMMRGERPVFKTKAQVRLMNMEKKFKQLKKDNKLDKYMKRKAKKEAHKEARRKPAFEQMYGYQ